MEKISKGLLDDLQHVTKIEGEVVSLVYRFYGGSINAENVQVVMDAWLADLPQAALRLKLTLEQSLGSGMTAFIVVGRAMIDWG